jgi:hypothetical protein
MSDDSFFHLLLLEQINHNLNRLSSFLLENKRALFITKALTLVTLFICYIVYAYYVLTPHHFQHFSLIDDGQTISNAQYLTQCLSTKECHPALTVVFESQFGRFRPIYWLIQTIIHFTFSFNPLQIHLFRIYFLGLVMLGLLNGVVHHLKGGPLAHLLASIIFTTSFTFTENLVRLGPGEPYQLIACVVFSLLYLSRVELQQRFPNWLVLASVWGSLLIACLIKETSIVLIPVIILHRYFKFSKTYWLDSLFMIGVVSVVIGGVFLSRPVNTTENYIRNYSLHPLTIMNTTFRYLDLLIQILSPFLFIAVLAGFFALFMNKKRSFEAPAYYYWILFFVFFTGILFPWQHVLERYLLLSLFSFAILAGFLLDYALNQLLVMLLRSRSWQGVLYLLFLGSITILISNLSSWYIAPNLGKTLNYVHWYSQYLTFEHEQVKALAAQSQPPYLNAVETLDNWEILFEIPIHLDFLYHQSKPLPLLPTNLATLSPGEVVFTSSSLAPVVTEEKLIEQEYQYLVGQQYTVTQIDLPLFVSRFRYRPLQTLIEPPLDSQPITHHWSLRKR